MSSEYNLPYCHGALLDEDADRMLQANGDFLIQSKHEQNKSHKRLVLAVKNNQKVVRIDIIRINNGYRIAKKSFATLDLLIAYFERNKLDIGGNETVLLKKPIKKGKFQLSHSDIRISKKIGSGAYGTVYKGILVRNNMTVAIKRIDYNDKAELVLVQLMKEARVMQLYDHINIVRFIGFVIDRVPYLLVMEYCKDGPVDERLRTGGKRISVSTRVDMVCQISRGVEYLHSKKDISARSCLLSGSIVKLADFGMSRAASVYRIDLNKPQNVRWLAPEVWRSGETRFSTDIYAFGITLWELFIIPYAHPYSFWKAARVKEKVCANSMNIFEVTLGYRLPSPPEMPESIASVMRRCWDQEPKHRPTALMVREELEEINMKFNGEDDIRTAIHATPSFIDLNLK